MMKLGVFDPLGLYICNYASPILLLIFFLEMNGSKVKTRFVDLLFSKNDKYRMYDNHQ